MRSILGVDGVEEEVSTLYSAFKAHKECRSEQIVFSERYLKFSD